jgi:hypothetical protein
MFVCVNTFLASRVEGKGGKVVASRAFGMRHAFAFIRSQERKRTHPNMVLIHDPSQESSSIDLLEVGIGVVDPDLDPFFLGWITFQNFHLVGLKLGEKKVRVEKKSGSKSSKMGRASQPLGLTPFFACMIRDRSLSCRVVVRLHVYDSPRSCAYEGDVCSYGKGRSG